MNVERRRTLALALLYLRMARDGLDALARVERAAHDRVGRGLRDTEWAREMDAAATDLRCAVEALDALPDLARLAGDAPLPDAVAITSTALAYARGPHTQGDET